MSKHSQLDGKVMGLVTWLGGLDWYEFATGWAERVIFLLALH